MEKNSSKSNAQALRKEKELKIVLLTVKELRDTVDGGKINTPSFQRWLIEKNIASLHESVDKIGLKRLPVLCKCKDDNKIYIIDGNNLRQVLINKFDDSHKVACILEEVNDLKEAAFIFKELNTRGMKIDDIGYTNLYMELYKIDGNLDNIYKDIWVEFLKNPENAKEVKKRIGFTIASLIEMLAVSTKNYRSGEGAKEKFYKERKVLLKFIINKGRQIWQQEFKDKGMTFPNGSALVSFLHFWFTQNLHKKHSPMYFLEVVNSIYKDKEISHKLKTRRMYINKDNADFLMEDAYNKMNGKKK